MNPGVDHTPSFPVTPSEAVISFGDESLSVIQSAFSALPSSEEISQFLRDADAAEARGYYNPVEDERLREAYARYLAVRVSLWELIQVDRKSVRRSMKAGKIASLSDRREFSISFCAAEIIVRTGEYLIDLARERSLIWQKLDEAEPRYGIQRKSFTRLYRQLTSSFRMHGFYRACEYFDQNRSDIMSAAPKEIAGVLRALNLPTASRGDHLKRYRRFVRHSLKRRHLSAWKKTVFSIFEMTGSDIADLKVPFVKPPNAPKRVSAETIASLKDILEPGDVLVTRHDDAMSNLFLPGFWPHSALWLGTNGIEVLEAKKDGVRFREIDETLQVDAFTIIRPNLSAGNIIKALERSREHVGKLYDFVFDFRTSDRLVCTEVIYRTYHGIGPILFELELKAGRHCLSAEALLNQGIGKGWFNVVATFGVGENEMVFGPEAKTVLANSFESAF